jgi:hypothetical protein
MGSGPTNFGVTEKNLSLTISINLDVESPNSNGSSFFKILPPESFGEAIFNVVNSNYPAIAAEF